MRTRCVVLLASLAAMVAAAFLVSAAAASMPPAPAYPWVQPWEVGATAPDVGQWTQPPASIPITATSFSGAEWVDASYPWVQPWDVAGGVIPGVGNWTEPPVFTLDQ